MDFAVVPVFVCGIELSLSPQVAAALIYGVGLSTRR
jgi:hypothetical protein